MPRRAGKEVESVKLYRFGYQGSESDAEIGGAFGNYYTTNFRMLDTRLGRWFSPDPIVQPYQSPYTSMDNNPVALTDVLGLCTTCGSEEGNVTPGYELTDSFDPTVTGTKTPGASTTQTGGNQSGNQNHGADVYKYQDNYAVNDNTTTGNTGTSGDQNQYEQAKDDGGILDDDDNWWGGVKIEYIIGEGFTFTSDEKKSEYNPNHGKLEPDAYEKTNVSDIDGHVRKLQGRVESGVGGLMEYVGGVFPSARNLSDLVDKVTDIFEDDAPTTPTAKSVEGMVNIVYKTKQIPERIGDNTYYDSKTKSIASDTSGSGPDTTRMILRKSGTLDTILISPSTAQNFGL